MKLYDAIAPIYDADMGASMNLPDLAWYVKAARAVNGPVLELGCGNGRVLAALRSAGIEALGIDLSLPMLRRARERCGPSVALAQMDLRKLSLRADFALVLLPYSLVTCLRNDEDWRQLANGLREALRPGASVILDAFIPRPALTDSGWLRDYARWLGVRWLVRHKRISTLADGCHRIERRYRCRGAFGGRTLHTSEIIRPYSPVELQRQAERFLGPVLNVEYDYGVGAGAAQERFCTITVGRSCRNSGFHCPCRNPELYSGKGAGDAPHRIPRADDERQNGCCATGPSATRGSIALVGTPSCTRAKAPLTP